MAEIKHPGVFIEEIPSGVHTIEGVPTSITAFVGRTWRGPPDEAVLLTAFADYERQFGGLWRESTLGFAVKQFFENGGTQAIIATSAAIYSASGASFARALFDGLVYGDADLGGAVRNARNYLLAVTELKKQRKHADWPKTYRAALAFALWGDPTARPSLGTQPPKLPPVQWQVNGKALELAIPKRRLKTASVAPYFQSTGFVVGPGNRVLTAVYSSGAIGRLVWQDVLGFVKYVKSHA